MTGGEASGGAAGHGLAEEVLVTGASGFLGRALVAALAESGRSVICLSRRPAPPPDARQRGSVRWIQGDVRLPQSYQAHLRPGIAVYHLASLRSNAGRHAGDFEAVNITASGELAHRCLDRGIRRFVLVTTAHLFGPSAQGETRRETGAGPFAGDPEPVAGAGSEPALGGYERSRRAELLEMRRLVAAGLDAVILCPTIVFGPDRVPYRNLITSELRRIIANRRPLAVLIGRGTAGRNLVYLDDVVGAALAAERLAPRGVELLLGGEPTSHLDLLQRTLALLGRRTPPVLLSIPPGVALAAARAADRLLQYDAGCGHAAAVVRMLRHWRFDSGKAQKLLGYRPLSLDEGLARTLRWLRGEDAAR